MHTSASQKGQQLFSRKCCPHAKQITKADGWACSHVSPWGCPPTRWHGGTVLSFRSWALKMTQVEVDCGAPALWQEVQAHRSSSSLPSPPLLCVSPQQGAGGPGMRESLQLLAATGLRGRGGTRTGPTRSRPLQHRLVWCPPGPAPVLCACCETTAPGAQGQKKMEGCVLSDVLRDV